MKIFFTLSLLLVLPIITLTDLTKDKLIVLGSLSNYGCDFDGDGRGDLSVWDPHTNTLYFQLTSNNKFYEKRFIKEDMKFSPVFADYDGDEKTDFVFHQAETGQWIFYFSSNPEIPIKTFLGNFFDMPIPVDVNGDRQYSPAVWRPNTGFWLLPSQDLNETPGADVHPQGGVNDLPFAADYDGDGKSDLIIWRTDSGYWYIDKSTTGYDPKKGETIQHGRGWDIIIPNDYDADGRCDFVVWRAKNQTWYFFYSASKVKNEIKFGNPGDVPLSSDLDGDKVPELITWNPYKKSWDILNTITQEHFSYKWEVPNNCIPASSILLTYH